MLLIIGQKLTTLVKLPNYWNGGSYMKHDPDAVPLELEAVMRALHKSAQVARETAIKTNTALVVVENGKLMRIPAKELMAMEYKINEED
ncbi:MAG: hypothetical protein OXE78_12035 [Gammaproteobacteria bacterium]|nr:hypothetical protein [Gammaproteobacteria bacterium]